MTDVLETIDRLKRELDALRPLPAEAVARVAQKLRLEADYHSNAIEGNTLTLGETRSLILHGLTAHGKPLRHHLDIQGHDEAAKAVEEAVAGAGEINHAFVRNLHRILLKEAYEMPAVTPDGAPVKRRIGIGAYKTAPNNVVTKTGEVFHYSPPESVHVEMTDLLDWLRAQEEAGEHPIIAAATFHYRFVRIHPFDDGNGRMARLLMNMILMRHGYTVAIVRREDRDRYIAEIEQANASGNLADFIAFIANCCEYSLSLHLRAARGESIEEPEDIDREIEIFKISVGGNWRKYTLKEYVDEVVRPFCEYCESKIGRMSEVFGYVYNPHYRMSGDTEEPFFSDNQTHSQWPLFADHTLDENTRALPREIEPAADIEIEYNLGWFRGKEKVCVNIRIENKFDPEGSIWRFKEGYSAFERSLNSQKLDDLQSVFDDLLRAVMKALGRRAP